MPKPVTMMTKPKRNHPDELVVGLVSISDRASQGVYEDKGIPSLQTWLGEALATPWRAETRLIQDDAATISATLDRTGRRSRLRPRADDGRHRPRRGAT